MDQALPPLFHSFPLGGDWCTLESSPLVFNSLLQKNGVRGAYAQEMYTIDPQDLEQLENDGGQVYGFVMLLDPLKRLSKTVEPESEEESESEPKEPQAELVTEIPHWVAKDDASITAAKDEKKKKKNKTQLYFANQVIPNACATQAVLSVIMNAPSSLDIGPVLANFKDFTKDFNPIDKGLAMTNCKDLRDNHNSLAERLEQEPSSLQKCLHNAVVHEANEDSLHYIAYVPVNGYIWELDGLEPQPIRRRPFGVLDKKEEVGQQEQPQDEEEHSPKSWLTVTGEVMGERIRLYPAGEERFVLFAIVKDPLLVLEEKLATEKQRAQGTKMEGILDQGAGPPPSASNESMLETSSPSSREQASSDTVVELERMVESLKRERKQEKLDIALKTADYWPAINMFLRHLVDEGKVNKKTGKLVTDQEETVPADPDTKMDQVTDQEDKAVPADADMRMDQVTDQKEESVPAEAEMKMDQVTDQQEVPVEAAKPVDTKAPKRARKKKTETKEPAKVEVAKDEESAKAGEAVAMERPARPEPKDLIPTEPSISKAKGMRKKQKTSPSPVIESGQHHPMELIQEPLLEPMQVSHPEPIQVSPSEPMHVSPVESGPETPETGRLSTRARNTLPESSTKFATKSLDSVLVPETLATGRGTKTKLAIKPFDSASGKKNATSQDPPWSTPPPPPPPPQPTSAKKRQSAVPKALQRTRLAKKQECHLPVNTEPLGSSPDGMEIDGSPAMDKEPLGSSSSELSSAEDYSDDSDQELMQSSREERRSYDTQQPDEIKPSKDAQQKGELEPPRKEQYHDIDMLETQQQSIERVEVPQHDDDQTQAPQQNIKLTEAQQQDIELTEA
ncbi:Ubiquitin carboxyl-terminal hydrolase bap1 [Podila epicladia]|nr:Ubiquitin carboxyl-terminal hydrolase bap1 [Podila epicladia]